MGFTKNIIGTNESIGGINLFESIRSTQLATSDTAGLMSPQDKSKLDGLENYIHPDTPAEIGTYMQVVIDKQGHIVGGRLLQDSTLSDYRIIDAYITPDNEIVLGENKIRPRMPDENVPWQQISNRPDTIAGYGIKDAYIAERLTGIINEHNLPERLRPPIATKQELRSAYSDIDVRLEAIRTLSYENFRYLFDENKEHKARFSSIEKTQNGKASDVEVEALKTISYENFRYLFDEMKNMADAIALLTKQLSDMQSKLDNIIGSGGSGGTCQCTDEDVQDTDVDQIFN